MQKNVQRSEMEKEILWKSFSDFWKMLAHQIWKKLNYLDFMSETMCGQVWGLSEWKSLLLLGEVFVTEYKDRNN